MAFIFFHSCNFKPSRKQQVSISFLYVTSSSYLEKLLSSLQFIIYVQSFRKSLSCCFLCWGVYSFNFSTFFFKASQFNLNEILGNFQPAHYSYQSNETALLKVVNDLSASDDENISFLIFLQLLQLPDNTDHDILLQHLQYSLNILYCFSLVQTISICIEPKYISK